jgi:hypothetical protein
MGRDEILGDGPQRSTIAAISLPIVRMLENELNRFVRWLQQREAKEKG